MKKIIVVSAVNLVEGGPLTVLQECLRYLSVNLAIEFEIIALVNRKELCSFENIKYLEFPKSKKSWINRLYYEYHYFSKLAKRLNPFLWLSLHDITPNVTANRLAVYCHNPSPFYELSFKEAMMDPKFALFNMFYKYLYRINIKKSNFVIVQQDWLRQELIKLYKIEKVIVSYPKVYNEYFVKKTNKKIKTDSNFVFFYPAFPRMFKNFEIICEAARILNNLGTTSFEVRLTISGSENAYARFIYNRYRHTSAIRFLGLQKREAVCKLYQEADCLVFPSKLETWGLPITEFKAYQRPIIVADREYAHETVGDYEKVIFFDPHDARQLSELMKKAIHGELVFSGSRRKAVQQPFASNWQELFAILLSKAPSAECTI